MLSAKIKKLQKVTTILLKFTQNNIRKCHVVFIGRIACHTGDKGAFGVIVGSGQVLGIL